MNFKKFGDSCPLNVDDLNEFKSVYDNKEVDIREIQLFAADLIHEGLKLATSSEQHFLSHDLEVEHAIKFPSNLKFCVAGYQELYKVNLRNQKDSR
ncbi:hypothetical protein TNCV_2666641 [Trichonephila clavipes]|nr:hypothetical protein TNCV_2666641 [Trichonephila clavipes]